MFNEDTEMIYNRWVSGIASRELKGQTLTVDDLVKKFSPEGASMAPKTLPYPLDRILESLADNFVKLSDCKMICEMSKNNPLIGSKKEKLQQLEQVIGMIQKAQKILEETIIPLNKILEG
jgi:hypothetical protein